MEDFKNNLVGVRIGLELLSGERIHGHVIKWSKLDIWITKDGSVQPIKVPKDIIARRLILLDEVKHEED